MVTALDLKNDDSFKQFIIISALFHFCFALFFVIRAVLVPSTAIEIPHSIRVDVVALPDKIIQDSPATTPPKSIPAVTPTAPKKLEEKVEPRKDLMLTQKKALDKIKALEAIEKMKNEMQAKQTVSTAAPQPKSFKGNIISSGNSFTGLSRLRVNEYLENLMIKIREHWELPQWLSNANLKATVIIEIDDRGYIIKNEVHLSSGNDVFDSFCTDAVSKTSRVEVPPEEIRGALITIRFPFQ